METITVVDPSTSDGHGGVRTRALHSLTWRKLAYWGGLAAVPIAVGMLVGRRSRLAGGVAGGLTALALGGARWQLQRWFTDEPAYELERTIGPLEIRRYAPRVEACTRVVAVDFDHALEQGFRRLATYIFGGNRGRESLAMTAPVTARGERLGMTAPVVTEANSGTYTMAFVMTPGRTLDALPRPVDQRVELRTVPARRVAVLRFRGRYRGDRVMPREQELLGWVRREQLEAIGTPMFAGFDPPWTLPWLRRNEVWVEIK